MKLRLHLFSFMMLVSMTIFGQINAVGIIGSATAGGWDNDTDMVRDANDSNVWTITLKLNNGEAKFRANDAWDINWGSADFPTGTGALNGPNIKVVAGDYTVTFNSSTGAYYFDVDSDIGIIGSATPGGWDNDTDMYIDQTDTNKYFIEIELATGEVKFRQNDGWDINWGATDFPTGVGTQNGPNIPVAKAGKYTVTFDKSTGAYDFEQAVDFQSIGVIGSATAGGWDADTDLTRDANDPAVWKGFVDLIVGEIKFRANKDWANNWGGTEFPAGTGVAGGANIAVPTAGKYLVNFNTGTLAYSFTEIKPFETIGIIGTATPGGWDADTDMVQDTLDPTQYSLDITLVNGEAKFRADNAWTVNWGAKDFPAGIGTQDGPNVPVLYGDYNVTFNTTTGAYNFKVFSDVGIIGSATPGGWDADTDMYEVQGDTNKYFTTLTLVAGDAKFRRNNDWAINWGGTDFPAGIGTQDGPNIPITQAGKYLITFDRSTGAYSFEEIKEYQSISVIGTATPGGWDTDTELARDQNNGDLWKARIDLTEGEIKFRANNAWDINWGGVDFPTDTAVAGGANIVVPEAGKYQIVFNTKSLVYTFSIIRPYSAVGIIGDATPGGWDTDTDMIKDETDPTIWRLRIELVDGEAKFRADNDWAVNWGSGDFPSGIAEQDGANIPVPAGDYKITFNTLTGEYNFEAVVEFDKISLVGKSGPFGEWPGTDDSKDTYLTKDPNDANHWTNESVTVSSHGGASDDGVKFRAEAAWATNWGSADFPTGVGTQDGPNIVTVGGTYKIDFKSDTGEYGFAEPNSTYNLLDDSAIAIFPNPTASRINVDIKNSDLKGATSVNVYDRTGKMVFTQQFNSSDNISIDASNWLTGSYMVQLSNGKYIAGKKVQVVR
ncbi:MAG: SusF/SusE family outer membrane protein [Saprospiraceae bacterium]|nr:SusF/SusE family outer membrane protein [Saprospiraceae bacterium]